MDIVSLLVPAVLLAVLIRVLLLPIKLVWKFVTHSLCGFLCIWLVNTLSAYTGIAIAFNGVTAATAGILGLPGVVLLIAAELFF